MCSARGEWRCWRWRGFACNGLCHSNPCTLADLSCSTAVGTLCKRVTRPHHLAGQGADAGQDPGCRSPGRRVPAVAARPDSGPCRVGCSLGRGGAVLTTLATILTVYQSLIPCHIANLLPMFRLCCTLQRFMALCTAPSYNTVHSAALSVSLRILQCLLCSTVCVSWHQRRICGNNRPGPVLLRPPLFIPRPLASLAPNYPPLIHPPLASLTHPCQPP